MFQNRWKIIFTATVFNLLFEYSLRGINNLKLQPALPLLLFAVYFTLFIMVEDLIDRYKLRDYQLMILSFFYGTIYCALTSGIIFINPSFLGISWVSLLYVNIIWWGALQAVLTFYLANRVSPRNWDLPGLTKIGWIVCIVVNLLALVVFQKSGLIPSGTAVGKLTTAVILSVSLLAFIFSLRKRNLTPNIFKKNKFLTALSIITVALFLFSAIFLTHDPVRANTSNVNDLSLKIISWYTIGLFIVLVGYRIITKKEIPV